MSEQEVFDALRYHIAVYGFGNRYYRNNAGELHRDDGPAVEYTTGDKFWYQNGRLHRTDGPAVELIVGGHMEWWQNGQRHRTDGPAVEWVDGQEWYINGKWLTEDEFNQAVKNV